MKTKSIRIQNFQSLGDVNLEIKDLTILWGPSDTGKSACIRAIKSLHRNSVPSSPIRYGTSKLKVDQVFEDDSVISFEKSKTVNSYIVGDKVLAKVGRDVPDEVRELLKTDKLVLDKDQSLDLSFAGQFDGTFLLSDSASVVTKTISSLSGIHYIYSALREASTQTQKLKSQNQLIESNIEGLKKYDDLQLEYTKLFDELVNIQVMNEWVGKEEKTLLDYQDILNRSLSLSKKEIDPFQVSRQIVGIQDDFYRIQNDEMEIEELKELLSSFSVKKVDISEELNKVVKTFNILNGIFLNMENEETGYNSLVELSNKNNTVLFDLSAASNSIVLCLLEESEIKAKIKTCITCGRTL